MTGQRHCRWITLSLLAFVVYNANLRPIPAGDTAPAALLPFVILSDHTLQFDRFRTWYADSRHIDPVWFRMARDGHYYSSYPITLPLLLTPLYAPVLAVMHVRQPPPDRILLPARLMEKVSASLIAALSVGVFLILAERFTGRPTALLLAIVYAFASQTWSTSSQALWQHGASELAIILTLLLLLRSGNQGARWSPAWAGLLAGLAVALRLSNVIFWAVAVLFALRSRWNLARKLAFLIPASVFPAGTIAYNLLLFGGVTGGYRGARLFEGNVLVGTAGLLFSPSRGLVIFSPVFIFAAAGAWLWFRGARTAHPEIYRICLLASIVYLLAMGSLRMWYGGYSYGPRMLADVVPCLVILFVPAVDVVARSRPLKTAFMLALVFSVAIQAIGAFCYPNGHWDAIPESVDNHPQRLWEWRDNQIVRSARAGPVVAPYRLAYRYLTHPGAREDEALRREGIILW